VTVGPKPHREAALGPGPSPGRVGDGAQQQPAGAELVHPSGPLAGVRRGFSVSRKVASRRSVSTAWGCQATDYPAPPLDQSSRLQGLLPGAHQLHLRITGDRTSGRLLGAQLLGDQRAQVAKRIDIPATALFHHMTVEGLSDLDLSYAPPFGSPWDAVQMAALAWTREVRGGQPTQAASHESPP
jgi:hypothetical protein